MNQFPHAAYIHVPFCRHRCGYCDFTLIAGRDDLIDRYLVGLEREIRAALIDWPPVAGKGTLAPSADAPPVTAPPARFGPLQTLFLGGGTPTHPSVDHLRRLFELIRRWLPLTPDVEFSVEANPLDLTTEKIAVLAEAGVNRISLGVQSFDEQDLQLLERDHAPADVAEVCQRLRSRCRNYAFDLIFGVPGQTLSSWRATLERALQLEPVHISTYGLTWEQGTSFWTRKLRGDLQPCDEDLERDQYALAMELLTAAGFEQYEISNFALPGFRCRHNLTYWRGDDYLAFGPGAARHFAGRRETNVRSVLGWLDRVERGDSPVAESEVLEGAHRARELIYLGLRMTDGLSWDEFQRRTGRALRDFAREAIQRTISLGWLEATPTHLKMTLSGRFLADRVAAEFL